MSIDDVFPKLARSGYEVTSPRASAYNCIAWAAGDSSRWWENARLPGYHWPGGASDTADDLSLVFSALGYERCDSDEAEADFEKIAIYADADGDYTHAARQLDDGKWTSKVGGWEDITHTSLFGLAGAEYGAVAVIMKRRKDGSNAKEKVEEASPTVGKSKQAKKQVSKSRST